MNEGKVREVVVYVYLIRLATHCLIQYVFYTQVLIFLSDVLMIQSFQVQFFCVGMSFLQGKMNQHRSRMLIIIDHASMQALTCIMSSLATFKDHKNLFQRIQVQSLVLVNYWVCFGTLLVQIPFLSFP